MIFAHRDSTDMLLRTWARCQKWNPSAVTLHRKEAKQKAGPDFCWKCSVGTCQSSMDGAHEDDSLDPAMQAQRNLMTKLQNMFLALDTSGSFPSICRGDRMQQRAFNMGPAHSKNFQPDRGRPPQLGGIQ